MIISISFGVMPAFWIASMHAGNAKSEFAVPGSTHLLSSIPDLVLIHSSVVSIMSSKS